MYYMFLEVMVHKYIVQQLKQTNVGSLQESSPMALLKFSISTSVFLISDEYTSLPTIGQKGTLFPSSCAMASARAVCGVQE